jgi:polysaccharide pyruvyl transferase WcaK-like protein
VARGFVYGNIVSHLLAVYRIRRQFLATQSLSILGADVMDGNYNNRASCNRANLASLARRFDIPVGIIGFSWNAAPKAQAKAALQRASRLGAQLYLRDPVSAARARRDGLCNVVETADIVFLGKRISNNAYNRVRSLRKARLRYVVVNISALLFAGESDIHGFVEIVRRILLLNIDVIILPHVSRPGADDKEICRAVARFFHKGNVALIDELLRPSDVCGLVKNAEFVISGRMHLAIMALSFAVPAIVTNSQGKVEGLVKLFNIEELCLQPGRDYFRRMSELINSIADHRQGFAERIERRLPEVIEMANRNFQWLSVR